MKTSFETVHKMIKDAFEKSRNGREILFGEDFERFHRLRLDILKECGWNYHEYMDACNSM
jgi:hypothetical protein